MLKDRDLWGDSRMIDICLSVIMEKNDSLIVVEDAPKPFEFFGPYCSAPAAPPCPKPAP